MADIDRSGRDEKTRRMYRRMPWFYGVVAACLLITAIAGFSQAGTNRPLRYYTDDGSTAMTYYTNGSGNNTSFWGINTDNPRCEFDINGTVCINGSSHLVQGVAINGTLISADGNNYPTALSVNQTGSAYSVVLARSGLGSLMGNFSVSGTGGGIGYVNTTGANFNSTNWFIRMINDTTAQAAGVSCNAGDAISTLSNNSVCTSFITPAALAAFGYISSAPNVNVTGFTGSGTTVQLNLSNGSILNATTTGGTGTGNISGNASSGYYTYFSNSTNIESTPTLYLPPGGNIQSAINNCTGGCFIQLGEGSYTAANINLSNGVRIHGSNARESIIYCNSTNSSCFNTPFGTRIYNIELSNLRLQGNDSLYSVGLNTTNMSLSKFDSVKIANFTYGVYGAGLNYYNDFIHMDISGNSYNVYFTDASNENHFFGGTIKDSVIEALHIDDTNQIVFEGTAWEGATEIINITNKTSVAYNNHFTDNRFEIYNNSRIFFDYGTYGNTIKGGYIYPIDPEDYGEGNIILTGNQPFSFKLAAQGKKTVQIIDSGSNQDNTTPGIYILKSYNNSGSPAGITVNLTRGGGQIIEGIVNDQKRFSIGSDGTLNQMLTVGQKSMYINTTSASAASLIVTPQTNYMQFLGRNSVNTAYRSFEFKIGASGPTLYLDHSSESIGVLTSNPNATLDIVGTLRVQNNSTSILDINTTGGFIFDDQICTATNGVCGIASASGNVTYSGNGTAGYIPRMTNNTNMNNSGVYDDGRNLTIGQNVTVSLTGVAPMLDVLNAAGGEAMRISRTTGSNYLTFFSPGGTGTPALIKAGSSTGTVNAIHIYTTNVAGTNISQGDVVIDNGNGGNTSAAFYVDVALNTVAVNTSNISLYPDVEFVVNGDANITGTTGISGSLLVNGTNVCLSNGTNCPAGGSGNVTATNGTAGYVGVFSSASNLVAMLINSTMIGDAAVNATHLYTSNGGSAGQVLTLNSTGGMNWSTPSTGSSSGGNASYIGDGVTRSVAMVYNSTDYNSTPSVNITSNGTIKITDAIFDKTVLFANQTQAQCAINYTMGLSQSQSTWATPVDSVTACLPVIQGTIINATSCNSSSGIPIPFDGYVRRVFIIVQTNGTLSSNQNTSYQVWINGINTGLNGNLTMVTRQNATNITNINTQVAFGDYIGVRATYPAWTTNPTQLYQKIGVEISKC